ncbi:MAG: hypothetical protein H6753_04935 [Candidatus Omnitrophica bacterium]|nr:hypothetical protein [Candidatus Omnitrophota bacterium]
MRKINFLILIFIVSFLTGCTGIKEQAKLLWGSSTQALENQRRQALVETFACSWEQCFSAIIQYANKEVLQTADENRAGFSNARPSDEATLKAVKTTNLEIFLQDRNRRIIVVMGVPGSVQTTEVGVFFTPMEETQTRIEITSLSTLAKIRAGEILFAHLGQKFQKINYGWLWDYHD